MQTIKLTGVKNIRDISYGNIKEKRLIRSSELCDLTDCDIKILTNEYNVKTIIDLRTQREVNKRKDIIIPNCKYYNIPLITSCELGITHENGSNRIPSKIPDLCQIYPKLVTIDKKEAWSKIFDILLNENDGTILWHCTIGKDRCGIVSSMIEYCLGIDDETILYDYLFTNNHIDFPNKYKLLLALFPKKDLRNRFKDIFIAKKDYLLCAFKYIEDNYGSRDNFLKEICGIDEDKKEMMRRLYLK